MRTRHPLPERGTAFGAGSVPAGLLGSANAHLLLCCMAYLFLLLLRCGLLLITASYPLMADELLMKNGDRLTGTVVVKQGKTLRFKVAYAGELSIKWADVAALRSTKPLQITFEDGSQRTAVLVAGASPLSTQLKEEGQPLTMTAINTLIPAEVGRWQHKHRIEMSLDLHREAKDTDDVRLRTEHELRNVDWRLQLDGEWDYVNTDNKTSKNRYEIDQKTDYFLLPRLYARGQYAYQRNQLPPASANQLYTLGLGYLFFDDAITQLELVSLFGQTRFYFEATPDLEFNVVGFQWNGRRRLFSTSLELFDEGELYWPSLAEIDYILSNDIGLHYDLSSHIYLSWRSGLELLALPASRRQEDWRHQMSLGVKW